MYTSMCWPSVILLRNGLLDPILPSCIIFVCQRPFPSTSLPTGKENGNIVPGLEASVNVPDHSQSHTHFWPHIYSFTFFTKNNSMSRIFSSPQSTTYLPCVFKCTCAFRGFPFPIFSFLIYRMYIIIAFLHKILAMNKWHLDAVYLGVWLVWCSLHSWHSMKANYYYFTSSSSLLPKILSSMWYEDNW